MDSRLFKLFCEMMDRTPARAVLTIAESERRMLENDVLTGRACLSAVAVSILSFCRFLQTAASRALVSPASLPIEHLAFYRNTVERLIEAGELPFFAKEQFDETFHESFRKAFAAASPEGPPLRILHLEDDPMDAELIERQLDKLHAPFMVTRAANEQDFQAAIQTDNFDVIISDSGMPGFDTRRALAAAREKFPQIPFIVLSGNANPRIKREMLSRGATDYVVKDDLAPLVATIRHVHAAKQQTQ